MHDFIGTRITPGCWVAVGGAGNRSAEYGMILHRVLDTKGGKIRTIRLRAEHHSGKTTSETKRVTISKGTKVVVVTPSDKVIAFFERIARYDATQEDHDLASKWIHGHAEDLFA